MARFTETSDHAGGRDDGGILKPSKLKTDAGNRPNFSTVGSSADVRRRENDPYAQDLVVGAKGARVKSQAWHLAERQRLTGTKENP